MENQLATLFRQLTLGVYVVGVAHENQQNAFTAVWVTQVSFDPLLLALSINPHHSSCPMLIESGFFSINVLRRDQQHLAQHFGEPASASKIVTVDWCRKLTGAPVLLDCLAYFDCELSHRCPAGDHELIIGRVVDGSIVSPGAEPMSYRETRDMDGSSLIFPNHFK